MKESYLASTDLSSSKHRTSNAFKFFVFDIADWSK